MNARPAVISPLTVIASAVPAVAAALAVTPAVLAIPAAIVPPVAIASLRARATALIARSLGIGTVAMLLARL